MNPIDRSPAACLSIAAGLHGLVLFWNPILLRTALQSLIARHDPPPIVIAIEPEIPWVPTPHRSPPVQRPLFQRMPIALPSFKPTEDAALGQPLPVPIAPRPIPNAETFHTGAAPLLETKHPRTSWGSTFVPPLADLPAPRIAPHAIPMPTTHPQPGLTIEGPAAGLHVISRHLPDYPSWAEEQGAVGQVRLRFSATGDGLVRSDIQVLRTSGYEALDRIAIDALRRWRFAPGASEESGRWGIITFTFSLAGR